MFLFRRGLESAKSCWKQRGLKKIMRENGLTHIVVSHPVFYLNCTQLQKKSASFCRLMALRKAEKEEEKRAREKIKQKLEEDKV